MKCCHLCTSLRVPGNVESQYTIVSAAETMLSVAGSLVRHTSHQALCCPCRSDATCLRKENALVAGPQGPWPCKFTCSAYNAHIPNPYCHREPCLYSRISSCFS